MGVRVGVAVGVGVGVGVGVNVGVSVGVGVGRSATQAEAKTAAVARDNPKLAKTAVIDHLIGTKSDTITPF